ncbi:hypothetical protein K1T35_47670 (plasmid) [Pseudonocardia sp. DSM 110487]|uniref:hypothetical protein n=1 Tax=Pseudonocardia sp. DSM 110487 TaxID=2865833 RepID=UPI001C69E47B|nr:hypothetical protein [Pseudonocardia sp. DSM 110487]QYN41030.1 hypothetical protein K1T35_47670 [Pseudonocardia sp. DSM 110487]
MADVLDRYNPGAIREYVSLRRQQRVGKLDRASTNRLVELDAAFSSEARREIERRHLR